MLRKSTEGFFRKTLSSILHRYSIGAGFLIQRKGAPCGFEQVVRIEGGTGRPAPSHKDCPAAAEAHVPAALLLINSIQKWHSFIGLTSPGLAGGWKETLPFTHQK